MPNKKEEVQELFEKYSNMLDQAVSAIDNGLSEYRKVVGPLNAEAAGKVLDSTPPEIVIDALSDDAVAVNRLLHEARRRYSSAYTLALRLSEST